MVRFILSEDEQTAQVAKEVETYKDIVFLHVRALASQPASHYTTEFANVLSAAIYSKYASYDFQPYKMKLLCGIQLTTESLCRVCDIISFRCRDMNEFK